MNIESLKEYINSINIGKKEYFLIKSFCKDNDMEIIDFFKKGEDYNYYSISNMFIQAFSNSIQDESILKYFIEKQNLLPKINFKSIITNYDMLVTYKHLFGFSKDEELTLLMKEKQYGKILSFLKENPEFKENEKIKKLIITDFYMLEKFEKSKIKINKNSYNEIDIYYNNVLGHKEKNQNFIKVDKFYEFIEKNKDKISSEKRKLYLKTIMKYGALTVYDFKKSGYWDYVFIPLKHGNEFPDFLENKEFFSDLIKYKELILSKKNPYENLTIMNNLSAEEKFELLINYIKNYKVTEYNTRAIAIFNNFLNYVNEDFIGDFFKEGIKVGHIFKYSLKEEFVENQERNEDYKNIDTSSKIMDSPIIKKNHHVIAKQILKYRDMFKYSVLNKFIPISKEIVEEKEFVLSLNNEELNGLVEELKSKNLVKTTAKILEMRLENKLEIKGTKEKKIKI